MEENGSCLQGKKGSDNSPREVVIGVTGHRRISETDQLSQAVDSALSKIIRRSENAGGSYRTVLMSPLAEGSDRFIARRVLDRHPDIELRAVLPMPIEHYMKDFESEASRKEFMELIGHASSVKVIGLSGIGAGRNRDELYERCGRYIVKSSDVLMAIWDGEPSRGKGGTGDVVGYAVSSKVPIIWIGPDPPHGVFFQENR